MSKKFKIGKIVAKGSIFILYLEGDNRTPFDMPILRKEDENKNEKRKRKRKKQYLESIARGQALVKVR